MSHRLSKHRQGSGSIQGLADLKLTEKDFCALHRRGIVCEETRRGAKYFKLRFRNEDGQQRVRYLGRDPAVAERVRQELKRLQLHRHKLANLRELTCDARKVLRRTKVELQPALELIGFHFHGLAIRKARQSSTGGIVNYP